VTRWSAAACAHLEPIPESTRPTAAAMSLETIMKSFAVLAGPIINGYAFCDLTNQRRLRTRALEWVESNPYETMFMSRIPAKAGDRHENLKRAIENAKSDAEKEHAYFDGPKKVEEFYAARKKNGADIKFCWESR
jgi:hypothetical protein